MHQFHLVTRGADNLQGVPLYAGRLIEECDYLHAVSDEHHLQQTAHAHPIQTLNATAQMRYGQLGDIVLTLCTNKEEA